MTEETKGYAERATCLVSALVVAGLGVLAWRYLEGAREMPWVLWTIAAAGAGFALCAPLRWIRTALRMNLFSQDLFKR